MATKLGLEIVTPDRKFYEDKVDMVIMRTIEGDIGVLYDHVATVAPLSVGVVKIKKDGEYKTATCAGGFVNINKELVTIITDAAEWPEEIDKTRAEAARKRAQERLNQKDGELDYHRAKTALAKAINRINISK